MYVHTYIRILDVTRKNVLLFCLYAYIDVCNIYFYTYICMYVFQNWIQKISRRRKAKKKSLISVARIHTSTIFKWSYVFLRNICGARTSKEPSKIYGKRRYFLKYFFCCIFKLNSKTVRIFFLNIICKFLLHMCKIFYIQIIAQYHFNMI